MSGQSSVAVLREHLETMFPGKWFASNNTHRTVLTGLPQIDQGITHGLTRRRITEWIGNTSSGKTTVLRSIIHNWCKSGFYIVYIDAPNRLLASDWAFVGVSTHVGDLSNEFAKNNTTTHLFQPIESQILIDLRTKQMNVFNRSEKNGKFWVVRNLAEQDVLWSAEQLVRSNIFDAVVLDAGKAISLNSKAYARLQRALDRSRCALLIVRDQNPADTIARDSWGCHSRLAFSWSTVVQRQEGLSGAVSIAPEINGLASRDGIAQNMEVACQSYAPNRLFTHPQVPDRRVPKARTRA